MWLTVPFIKVGSLVARSCRFIVTYSIVSILFLFMMVIGICIRCLQLWIVLRKFVYSKRKGSLAGFGLTQVEQAGICILLWWIYGAALLIAKFFNIPQEMRRHG